MGFWKKISPIPGERANIRKATTPESELLKKLRRFLDKREPELVYFLVNLWNAQGEAITYKEIREAILSGDITPDLLKEWQQDYTRFVARVLQPMWQEAMVEAAKDIEVNYPVWRFDPMHQEVEAWVENHGAEFVTNSTQTQIMGLRAAVQRAAVLENINVDTLARAIRPMVGLTKQQCTANLRYFQTLIDNGMSEEKATDKATRYAARQHRYRGYNIARTELAFSYNQGSYFGIKQAQGAGLMGEAVKVWCTADDERVCPICGGLEGKKAQMEEDFDFQTKLEGRNATIKKVPPAHPSCRCVVMYKEVAPPAFRRPEKNLDTGVVSDREDVYNGFKEKVHKDIRENYPLKVNDGKQDKHIRGKPNFDPTRSELWLDPLYLIGLYAGKSEPRKTNSGVWSEKERFVHSENIGVWRNEQGDEAETPAGMLHYSKSKGVHIVPANPDWVEKSMENIQKKFNLLGKNVRVTYFDGKKQVFEGKFIDYTSEADNEPDPAAIGIRLNENHVGWKGAEVELFVHKIVEIEAV